MKKATLYTVYHMYSDYYDDYEEVYLSSSRKQAEDLVKSFKKGYAFIEKTLELPIEVKEDFCEQIS